MTKLEKVLGEELNGRYVIGQYGMRRYVRPHPCQCGRFLVLFDGDRCTGCQRQWALLDEDARAALRDWDDRFAESWEE